MCTHQQKIEQFIGHFRRAGEEIDKVQNCVHRKILYVTAFDAISRAPGKVMDNYERYSWLVVASGVWEECCRVSLPQLIMRLSEHGSPGALLDDLHKVLLSYDVGDVIYLDRSPSVSEVMGFSGAVECAGYVYSCTYVDLFYQHRCSLVHEFREPGYVIESDSECKPFYHSMTNKVDGEVTWELVFPVCFLKGMYFSALKWLSGYLLTENINPYDSYEFGSIWKPGRKEKKNKSMHACRK